MRHRCRTPIEKMDGSCGWITCADNSMLPPMVIHKGKRLYHSWFTEVDGQNAKFAHPAKGYMTDKLEIVLLPVFDITTKEHARVSHGFSLWMVIAPITAPR